MTKITTPGVYDITFEQYLGDTCGGVSISAHGLAHFLTREEGGTATPAHWWAHSPYNPNREPERQTTAFDVGRAAHSLVLGEPQFAKYFVVCPHDNLAKHPGKAWNDEWKARVDAGQETRTLIRSNDWDMIQRMAAAVKRSPQVGRAFAAGKPERSLIWRDEATGIWIKSRPDWLPDDPAQRPILDFKAHADIAPDKFARDAFAFNYHLQAAMQRQAVREVMAVEPIGVAHVVQEKEPPFLCELRMFRPTALDYGERLFRRALGRFATCWERHRGGQPERIAWPGYTTEASYIEEPYTVAKRIEDDQDHGSDEDDGTGYAAAV